MRVRITHWLMLLGVLIAPLATVWQDPKTDLPTKIVLSFGVFLMTCFDPAQRGRIVNYVLGAAGVFIPLVTLLAAHVSGRIVVGMVAATALAVFADLQRAFGPSRDAVPYVPTVTPITTNIRGGGPKAAGLALLLGSTLLALSAQAQTVTTTTVAPPLSFCLGAESTTCVVPDLGLQAVSYDLKAKAWAGGITGMGVGYALLFASDKPYASGVAVHATLNFDQKKPSYFAPTFSAVVFRWFEAGYTPTFLNGSIGHALTLAINFNAEAIAALVTNKTLTQRLSAARNNP